jgi:cold shock CspA family protein
MLQSASLDGRIQYQRNGETFYIPFSANDFLYTNQIVNLGDRVRFNVALNSILGAYYACRIEPVNSNSFQQQQQQQMPKQLYRGIITSLKDTFGKIEREDLLKETFFHFTEYKSGSNANDEQLRIGLNVEFEIQDKYGKEIATNIKSLPEGTVCFDELSQTVYIGRVVQAPIRLNNGSVTLGRLIYDNNQDNLGELTFGENDRALIIASDATANGGQNNKYTLLEGDFVQFRIATDKRRKFATQSNNIQRATQLTLIEEHNLAQNSQNTHENREKGVLIKINNDQIKYGAIKCLEREDLVYFAFNEIINYAKFKTDTAGSRSFFINQVKLEVGDSLEFSVMQCQKDQLFKNGLKAIRVRQLAKNSVQFEIISTEVYTGYVDKEAVYTSPQSQGDEINENNCGMIRFDHPQTKQTRKILFSYQNQQQQEQEQDQQSNASKTSKTLFYYGDKVQFNIFNCVKTNKQYAVNIKTIEQRKETGFITMLKESYGFIELNCVSNMPPLNCKINSLPKDIFFHFSSLNAQCSANELEVGDEVEFLINRKTKQKLCADNVTKLPCGTIKPIYVRILKIFFIFFLF